jgi:WD40 repeat protein
MPRRLPLVLAFACLGALPLGAAQPQFLKIEGAKDFLDGETEGISVDSEGRVRLAPASKVLYDTDAPYVWCLARDDKSALYAGTGNDGKVFRIDKDGTASLYFDAPELEVHALAFGPDGKLYVGTSPEGKVYAVASGGVGIPFYDPDDKYIWALAFDKEGQLLVATGSEGKLHLVDSKGQGKVILTASDTHVVSLATDTKGDVFAGSSPSGILYRIDKALKVFVIHDSSYREVKALETGAEGSLYAVVVDGKDREEPRPAPAPLPTPAPAQPGQPEVTLTESFALLQPVTPTPSPRPSASTAGQKGAVLRILPTGEVETLWSSTDDMPHALLKTDDGVLVATGNKGKLYLIREDRTWTMVGTFPAEQITALQRGEGGGVLLGTSNPGKVLGLGGKAGERGTFTSKVKDTDTVSSWGRIRWEADVPGGTELQVETRSGNTSAPDTTWADWSAPYSLKDGDPVKSERARFIQLRAVLVGKDGATPVVDSISAAYLQRNLRPQLQSITVHPPGEVFAKQPSLTGETEILGLEPGEGPEMRPGGQPARSPLLAQPTAYSRKLYQRGMQTFAWKADDPNGDSLVYDVQYRAVGDAKLRGLRKATTDTVLAWDTSTVPNGRYVIKVTARDSASNPESLALSGDKESTPFDVDNSPPIVSASIASGSPARVRAVVRDDSSIVRKAEYSVDGGRWQEVHPVDGINDAREETYEIAPGAFSEAGPHILVVRATDLLGNVATARVELR